MSNCGLHQGKADFLAQRATAARNLIELLKPLAFEGEGVGRDPGPGPGEQRRHEGQGQANSHGGGDDPPPPPHETNIISAIQALASVLFKDRPLFAAFHDGQVHHPLGGGAYAFQNDIVGPVLLALANDEEPATMENEVPDLAEVDRQFPILATDGLAQSDDSMLDLAFEDQDSSGEPTPESSTGQLLGSQNARESSTAVPTRPIIVHAGAQPNNSPHAGTLVVFCYAFLLARELRDRARRLVSHDSAVPSVTVEITFVDTAPVKDAGCEIDGVHYQRSYRDVPAALVTHMPEYEEVLGQMSRWSGIPFKMSFQSNFFSHPSVPSLLTYMVEHRARLASQLSPKYNALALRAACPVQDCGLAEKHGRFNRYTSSHIIFNCPHHGEHDVSLSRPEEVARLEANAPTRNLIRSMQHLLDDSTHHIRITGTDYAGTYQEAFLYRPLAEWSATTGLAMGQTPHILYTPLIVDWSGAKLSKSLYVREGGYDTMKILGTDGLCSYVRLESKHGREGLRRMWVEVERWMADPRKLFRSSFSVEYLQGILSEKQWK
ncbi:hypothetical protein PT974_06989 [Cladobotryum mycophilum]|uniref:Uncharacterized protein n=1 Tax=Cladobotryum mycophilum TaxID=491253 RepID=A0ABR0SP62_9HYPO